MKNIDWNTVEEAKGFEKLPAGGYVCGITSVEDVEASEYLKFEFDIAEGEFKNYYRELYESKNFWGGKFIKSYKEKARGFFKKMLTAFEKSNPGFTFNNDEKTLKRKLIGLVIGYEEYVKNDDTIGERITVVDFLPVEDIRSGKFEVPKLKEIAKPRAIDSGNFEEMSEDDDLPF